MSKEVSCGWFAHSKAVEPSDSLSLIYHNMRIWVILTLPTHWALVFGGLLLNPFQNAVLASVG